MYSATKWAVTAIGYGVREELRGSGVQISRTMSETAISIPNAVCRNRCSSR
jgi:short-subunit dehydrogenase